MAHTYRIEPPKLTSNVKVIEIPPHVFQAEVSTLLKEIMRDAPLSKKGKTPFDLRDLSKRTGMPVIEVIIIIRFLAKIGALRYSWGNDKHGKKNNIIHIKTRLLDELAPLRDTLTKDRESSSINPSPSTT